MFISLHIPKTAGTTLAYIFDYGCGRRIMYDYKSDYSNALMDDFDFWVAHRPFIERQFDFIHGHFFYRKYADLFPAADFIVCLRHPVERIISQFNHVVAEANPSDWHFQAITEHNLDVVGYAEFDGVKDAQARHCEGRDLRDYDFVFLSENLKQNFSAFQSKYQFGRQDPYMPGTKHNGALPRMNARTENRIDVTTAQREAIYRIATEDVEVYRKGAERAGKLVSKYL